MLDFSFASLKIPWLREVATMAPCSQLVAKTKKTPFYGPLTSGFAVHCVYSGLPISHGNRPNVPKPTRKNNFRRVQLPSAPPDGHNTNTYFFKGGFAVRVWLWCQNRTRGPRYWCALALFFIYLCLIGIQHPIITDRPPQAMRVLIHTHLFCLLGLCPKPRRTQNSFCGCAFCKRFFGGY